MLQLTVEHAVEKVLFRLALRENGAVSLCRVFLELPFALHEVETAADKVADGVGVVKNEFGEFLTYEFPELMQQQVVVPATCPTCGGPPPTAPTDGGQEVRAPLVCDTCYRTLRRTPRPSNDAGALDRVKKLFKLGDDEAEDPAKAARVEHEVFFVGLSLGVEQFTHTAIAAQSRLPAQEIKTRLDRMAGRRYINVGLLPSGDAVGYRFPPGLSYPRPHYRRFADDGSASYTATGKLRGLQVTPTSDPPPARPGLKIVVTPKGRRGPPRR